MPPALPGYISTTSPTIDQPLPITLVLLTTVQSFEYCPLLQPNTMLLIQQIIAFLELLYFSNLLPLGSLRDMTIINAV
jgi:hypothetical protein